MSYNIGKKVSFNGGIQIKGSLLQGAKGVTLRLLLGLGKPDVQGQVVINDVVVAMTPRARITNKQARDLELMAKSQGYVNWPLSKTF